MGKVNYRINQKELIKLREWKKRIDEARDQWGQSR